MKISYAVLACVLGFISISTVQAGLPLPDHPMFSDAEVQVIHIQFYDDNFWEILEDNYEDEIYLEASFDWLDIHFDSIGVRFKGGSSYVSNPTMKKSFKFDFDVFVQDQEIYGINKINLNCNFNDPSFVREISCYELCDAVGLPSLRRGFAALYINDIYWGLYTVVEQLNSVYIEEYYGSSEDGNLWKGDNYGSLEYLGNLPDSYYSSYELKTNETQNDWTDLIELTYLLNNTPSGDLPDTLAGTMDVGTALGLLAVDNMTVNLDSYVGRCCNYYLYHMDRDDRFFFANWDLNESWGVFNQWGLSVSDLQSLDPFWVSETPGEYRPMAELLWDIDEYRQIYYGFMLKLMDGAGHQDSLVIRMDELRNIARDWVYLEEAPRRLFSPDQFESAMDENVPIGPGRYAPALETFVRARDDFLRDLIGQWDSVDDLVLNELMAKNDNTVSDEYGEFDDWIEITNTGTSDISLSGFFLTDNMAFPYKYAFPDTIIHPAEHFLVWADDDSWQGSMHADFKLDADGEEVYLLQDSVVVDMVTFPELETDQSYGRYPDGIGEWMLMASASPWEPNEDATGFGAWEVTETPICQNLEILCQSPVNGSVSITIHGGQARARLDVYDICGRLTDTIYEGYINVSETLCWNATSVAAGVYFLCFSQEGNTATLKVTVIN